MSRRYPEAAVGCQGAVRRRPLYLPTEPNECSWHLAKRFETDCTVGRKVQATVDPV